jgi:hypothetical protein
MSDAEKAPKSAGPGAGAGSAKVVTITVIDPFCKGTVDVEVDKPDTANSADVELASSVSGASIMPTSHTVPPATTADTKTFNVSLPTGSMGSVTFKATARQSGSPHSQSRTVGVDCTPSDNDKRCRVVGIIVPSPFCRGDVRVVVAKPDANSAATVTLTSSVDGTDIKPVSHAVPADNTRTTTTFAVSLPAQTKAQTVTLAATIAQEGYEPHGVQTKVDVRCEPAGAPAGQGCDPEPPRPRGFC